MRVRTRPMLLNVRRRLELWRRRGIPLFMYLSLWTTPRRPLYSTSRCWPGPGFRRKNRMIVIRQFHGGVWTAGNCRTGSRSGKGQPRGCEPSPLSVSNVLRCGYRGRYRVIQRERKCFSQGPGVTRGGDDAGGGNTTGQRAEVVRWVL